MTIEQLQHHVTPSQTTANSRRSPRRPTLRPTKRDV